MRMVPTGGTGYCLKMSVAGSGRVGGSQERKTGSRGMMRKGQREGKVRAGLETGRNKHNKGTGHNWESGCGPHSMGMGAVGLGRSL